MPQGSWQEGLSGPTLRARDVCGDRVSGVSWPALGFLACRALTTLLLPKDRVEAGLVVVPAPEDQEGALLNQSSGF